MKDFYPWKSRSPNPITVIRKWKETGGRDRFYQLMSDGSIRRPFHERHERKVLGLSPRQHRKAKRKG